MEQGNVSTSIENGIGTITFGHPRGNSLPGALLRGIAAAVERCGGDDAVRVVVLRSEGEKVFCGGASFDEFQAAKNLDQAKHFFSGFAVLIMAIRHCPKFVIGRVQGKAVGGGVGVVAACDYVLATEAASIRLSELAIGIGPFVIGPAVQRKVGLAAFSELAIDAEWRDAAWARAHGLYARLFPDISALDAGVAEFAAKLAGCHGEAMRRLKAVLWEGTEQWGDLLPKRYTDTSELALTDFVQQKIAAVNR